MGSYFTTGGSFVRTTGFSSISIGGRTYVGNNVSIQGNRVFVDGVEQAESYAKDGQHSYEVTVNATNLERLDTVGPVTVNGSVGGNISTTGSVTVTKDCNSINTMGSVHVGGNCRGGINTMGKVIVGSRS